MKQKDNTKPKQGHSANMLLYAVAPQPKLSTDAIALDGAVVSRGNGIGATSETYLMDCIVGMKHYPDKYFDLAVVDPPYGINRSGQPETFTKNPKHKRKQHKQKDWDSERPNYEYFTELFRVSKNQIIWGANYFSDFLPPSMGWIFWDKGQDLSMSDGELAYTSFQVALRRKVINRVEILKDGAIHPTQKPIRLYDWVFKNYSEPGQRVLDTHLGSGSSRISAHKYGLNFTGFEIDEEYYYMQEGRFEKYQSQLNLFNK